MNITAAQMALEALKQVAQALAWSAHGECRGYHDKLPAAGFALELAESTIAALEAEIERPEKPIAYLKFWAYQQVSPDGSVNTDEGLEVCRKDDIGMDRNPAFPVFTMPQEPASPAGFTGMSDECNFATDTWTFKMDPGYKVGAGQYLITKIPKASE